MSDHFPAGLGQRAHTIHRELDELASTQPNTGPRDRATTLDRGTLRPARVLAQHSGRWLVAEPTDDGFGAGPPRLVSARGRLRDTADGPPATGDWVALDEEDAIVAVLPRTGTITRRAAGDATTAQTIAAGVDVALIAEPAGALNPRRAERFVALARAGGVEPVLVVTKADLDPDADRAATQLARDLGVVDGYAVSVAGEFRPDFGAMTPESGRNSAGGAPAAPGIGALRAALRPGTTTVLLGPSGAGKSTLANALLGAERMETGAVRASDGRGRHTTVTRELLPMPSGALLLDTPGMREVGLWDGGADGAFAEIDALAARCRFANCAHDGEPGCAVEPAVDPERLAAWRKLAREQAWVDDRRAATREREARGRHYARLQRQARGAKGNHG